jgi:hypothetical protein
MARVLAQVFNHPRAVHGHGCWARDRCRCEFLPARIEPEGQPGGAPSLGLRPRLDPGFEQLPGGLAPSSHERKANGDSVKCRRGWDLRWGEVSSQFSPNHATSPRMRPSGTLRFVQIRSRQRLWRSKAEPTASICVATCERAPPPLRQPHQDGPPRLEDMCRCVARNSDGRRPTSGRSCKRQPMDWSVLGLLCVRGRRLGFDCALMPCRRSAILVAAVGVLTAGEQIGTCSAVGRVAAENRAGSGLSIS